MEKEKVKYTFKKNERLSNEKSISELFSSGKSFIAYPIRVVYLPMRKSEETSNITKILVSVSKKKFKSAVKRNRIKRLLRESYRLNKQIIYQPIEKKDNTWVIAFIYLDTKIASFSTIEKSMKEALNKINLQK